MVDQGLAFDEAFLGPADLIAPFGDGLFALFAKFEGFFIGLEAGFAGDGVGLALGVFQDGLFLDCVRRPQIALLPTQEPVTEHRAGQQANQAV
jgi:hypothetical protein